LLLFKLKSYKSDILRCKDNKLDQAYIGDISKEINLKICGLDRNLFTSICQTYYAQTNNVEPFKSIITFHFSGGIVGRMKYHQAHVFLKKVKENPDLKMGQILVTSEFFLKTFNQTEFDKLNIEQYLQDLLED
jgi:hypothetical protein